MAALSPGVLTAGLTGSTGSLCTHVSISDTIIGGTKPCCPNFPNLNMTGGRPRHSTSGTGKHGATHLKYAGTTNRILESMSREGSKPQS